MLKVTLTVLAVALAGTASAAGWRSMRIDASSEADFTASVSALRDKLPEVRRHVLDLALNEIWVRGAQVAAAEQRDHSASEYFHQLDGLSYKEVVVLADPTGETVAMWRGQVRNELYTRRVPSPRSAGSPTNPWTYDRSQAPGSQDGANQTGGVAQIEANSAWQSRSQ
jgi:hypothetical protein